ncbi:MAG: radical SAM protein [Candidatus Latescibacteria bacterium]|nr:radical SAM protein [Candidatus Latescibacterota bacterium]
MLKQIKALTVVLIQPSRYDDDGFIIRYVKGVLPSNTLACLRSLTLDFTENWKKTKGIDIDLLLYDEMVDVVPFKKIASKNKKDCKVVVALVGVQSNQFPRASDIAKKFTSLGVKTIIGGFHVSGIIALFNEPTSEMKELMDIGVTIVHGEAETQWEDILSDVVDGREKLLYRLTELPDISRRPMPHLEPIYMKKFALNHLGTLDCSRGCPFNCSFCTVVNVQGKKMRYRCAESVLSTIRDNFTKGITGYFFTDDNFSRNPEWENIFDGMIKMIAEDGLDISFMMQVDTRCHLIKNFTEKAAQAGCTQVFIGMESLNTKNLEAVGKKQNKVNDYAAMIDTWHKVGVMTHVGYIIGFPYDTPESVREDLRKLKEEVKVDQASFFMLTPLPGSKDHYNMIQNGEYMDPDLNKYDSFHAAMKHPTMTEKEWYALYNEAWDSFYCFENLKNVLIRAGRKEYWNIFRNIMWYKNSLLEPRHPMVGGFMRRKHRTDVRPGTHIMPLFEYIPMRIKEMLSGLKKRVFLFFELQELWLLTRKPDDPTFRYVADFTSYLSETKNRVKNIQTNEEWNNLITSLKTKAIDFYDTAVLRGKTKRRIELLISEMNLYLDRFSINKSYARSIAVITPYLNSVIQQAEEFTLKHVAKRRKITSFWELTWRRLKQGKIFSFFFSIPKVIISAIRDFRMSVMFALHLKNKNF